jgi:hypothetical protein
VLAVTILGVSIAGREVLIITAVIAVIIIVAIVLANRRAAK